VDGETLENVYWLYCENPPGHDIQLIFGSAALTSVEVKRNNPAGGATSVIKMDIDGIETAPPYREFLDRKRP
jgi:hypothetical protein